MATGLSSPMLKRLIDHVETHGPINTQDTWLGKRSSPRTPMALAVRLWRLDNFNRIQGPAFTARSRDVSEQGLGLTVPYQLEMNKIFRVEMFTTIGTIIGRMQALHCTQTVGGYKLGMQWVAVPRGSDALSAKTPQPKLGMSMPPAGKPQSEVLTIEQALEEIRQAMRKYYVASISKGLLGLSMEREIGKILSALPKPEKTEDPRRKSYRHEVEGQVHLMVSTPQGHEFSNNDMVDLSASGARVVIVPPKLVESRGKPPEMAPWQEDATVSIGIWTANGTLWLPAKTVHCDQRSPEMIFAGLEFNLDQVMKDFT